MAGKTLDLKDIIVEDQLGCEIARKWIEWNTARKPWLAEKEEVRKYVYATDTTKTTNSVLPWKNKTTVPKLCQIRDNLYANYVATLFPKRKWLRWEASNPAAADKRNAITQYMSWVINQEQFKTEMHKLVLDYVDYGNCFAMVEWLDERVSQDNGEQVGFVGPVVRRISPLDIVFNPTASSFVQTPKIIRSLITIGELKDYLQRLSVDDNQDEYQIMFDYIMKVRQEARQYSASELVEYDNMYMVDGFTSFRQYLDSDFVEILTFYGDLYDREKNEFFKNHQIMVLDRHKVISKKPHPSTYGHTPIFHTTWRKRQDNIWGMGPLDNLVGLQYRIDHIENLKADVFDLIAFPVLKVKGLVEDFEWGPFQKVYVGDDGDVDVLQLPFQVLQTNQETIFYQTQMEEMAGAPKEAMGFRSPGEKTKYEVQRLENASARIFANKTSQFEEEMVEKILNAQLEMARRKLVGTQQIPVFNDEFQFTTFTTLTAQDITGVGTLKPIGARHFAEKAETVQNLTNFFGSPIGQDPAVKVHFSGVVLARAFEEMLDLQDYGMVQEYVRLDEEATGQQLAMEHQNQVQNAAMTPSGLNPADADMSFLQDVPLGP